ncbi:hypothetical protein JMJ77_0011328, partial [Colletotrichum scovillei]
GTERRKGRRSSTLNISFSYIAAASLPQFVLRAHAHPHTNTHTHARPPSPSLPHHPHPHIRTRTHKANLEFRGTDYTLAIQFGYPCQAGYFVWLVDDWKFGSGKGWYIRSTKKSPHEISKFRHARHPSKEKEEENNLSGRFHLLLRVSLLSSGTFETAPNESHPPPTPGLPGKGDEHEGDELYRTLTASRSVGPAGLPPDLVVQFRSSVAV